MIFKLELLKRTQTGKWERITYAWINADKDRLEEIVTALNYSAKEDFYWDIAND